jgi:hypothetical protein
MSICRVGGIEGGRATRCPMVKSRAVGTRGETLGGKRVTIIKKSGG